MRVLVYCSEVRVVSVNDTNGARPCERERKHMEHRENAHQIDFIMVYTAHRFAATCDLLLLRTRGVCVDMFVCLYKQWL